MATPSVSRQPAPALRMRERMLVLSIVTAMFLPALVLVHYAAAPSEDAAAVRPDRMEQAAAAEPAAEPNVQPVPAAPAPAAAPVASANMTAPVVTKRPMQATAARPAETRVAPSAKSTAPIAVAAIASAPVHGNVAAAAVHAPVVTAASAGPAVTVTGCLEISIDGDEFRLNDTDGIDAPKARSWRTGFLKKRPTPVALVEPPDPRGLQMQVGKRVAATGLLIDRELKVSSVHVVGPSCGA